MFVSGTFFKLRRHYICFFFNTIKTTSDTVFSFRIKKSLIKIMLKNDIFIVLLGEMIPKCRFKNQF